MEKKKEKEIWAELLFLFGAIMFVVMFVLGDMYWFNYCVSQDELWLWYIEQIIISLMFMVTGGIRLCAKNM